MVKPVKVKILDYEYLIKSDADLDQVYRVAEYFNGKIKEVNDKEGLSEKKRVVLAALNIAGEYFQLLMDQDARSADIRQRSKALIYNIDSIME